MTTKRYSKATLLRKQIGKNLRDIRISADLTQKELGDILEVSFQQIQKYENGTNNISPEKLFILKTFYDVPFDTFFSGILGAYGHPTPQRNSKQCVCKRLKDIDDPLLKKKLHSIMDILIH